MKKIEELTDDDLAAIWPAIGGVPHLFEYGKDELKSVLISGFNCEENDPEPIGLQLDYYTMAAIVDILRNRGFETADVSHYFVKAFDTKVTDDTDNGGEFHKPTAQEKTLTNEEIIMITRKSDEHVASIRKAVAQIGRVLNDSAEAGHQAGYWSGYSQGMIQERERILSKISNITNIEADSALNIIAKVDSIRIKHGAYIFAFPIKYRDKDNKTYKEAFGWEVEFEDGKVKNYGYSGEPEINSYQEALQRAIEYFNQNSAKEFFSPKN